ncbi:MAG: DUF2269 family protein [Acidimicrobiales bacterium]
MTVHQALHQPASSGQVAYAVLLAAHVASAVVGFGAVAVSGIYGHVAARTGTGDTRSLGELRRYFRQPGRAEWLVVPVPFFGVGALAVSNDSSAAHAWVFAALVIWAVAAALLVRVIRPAEAELHALLRAREPPPGTLSRAGNRINAAAAACDVCFFAALVLMVIRPG